MSVKQLQSLSGQPCAIAASSLARRGLRTRQPQVRGPGGGDHQLDRLLARLAEAGAVVEISPTASYVGLLREGRKFAVVSPAVSHLDIGLRRDEKPVTSRFLAAGTWNVMVTHRVRLTNETELDQELLDWLLAAYEGR